MAGGAAGVGRVRGSMSRCSGLAWGEGGWAGLQEEPTIIHKMFETNLSALLEKLCIPCL